MGLVPFAALLVLLVVSVQVVDAKDRAPLIDPCRYADDAAAQAAATGLARIGRVAGYRDFAEASAAILTAGGQDQQVRALIGEARGQRDAAGALLGRGDFPGACDRAATAAEQVLRAYCAAQKPVAGEFRAWWCHSAFGVEGLNWDESLRQLAANGFTAILPNMLWGGAAFYPSTVLPAAAEVATNGDQLAACVAAGKKHGIQIHVWKVNWNLGWRVPPEFVAKLRAEKRLQTNARAEELLWLCPSHPDNQRLEIESMVEVARRYDVDGLHFDYIRYPDADHCFCAGCRDRFARATGAAAEHWPQDVLAGGARRATWLDWRRGNITAVVRAVSEQARAIKPKLKLSAAVFRHWTVDRDAVGQDWKQWCEAGWLDFVCPMDYTEGDVQFENWVTQQQVWAGRTPCYPGIGVSASSSLLPPDQVIAQINITRRHQTGGFVLFNYGPTEARDLLPLLGLGITARTAADHRP